MLEWKSEEIECWIGSYSCQAGIKRTEGGRFFEDLDDISIEDVYANLFRFDPEALSIASGKLEEAFQIAPKSSTPPGYYQLKFSHTSDYYSAIPPLFIIAQREKLSIPLLVPSPEICDKGKSLPFIFDFTGIMPENDITITGYTDSKYLAFQQAV